MAGGVVEIVGLRELRRACRLAGNQINRDMNTALKAAGEPVRQRAEVLAVAEIPRMSARKTSNWAAMRLGIARDSVYVAPVERGTNTKKGRIFRERYARPNLKTKLLDEAMAPALTENDEKVAQEFQDAVKDMGRAWARV